MFLRSWRAHQALPWAHQPSFHPSTYVRVCVRVFGCVWGERGCEGRECSRVNCRPQETVAVAKEGGLASFFFVLLQQVCRRVSASALDAPHTVGGCTRVSRPTPSHARMSALLAVTLSSGRLAQLRCYAAQHVPDHILLAARYRMNPRESSGLASSRKVRYCKCLSTCTGRLP